MCAIIRNAGLCAERSDLPRSILAFVLKIFGTAFLRHHTEIEIEKKVHEGFGEGI